MGEHRTPERDYAAEAGLGQTTAAMRAAADQHTALARDTITHLIARARTETTRTTSTYEQFMNIGLMCADAVTKLARTTHTVNEEAAVLGGAIALLAAAIQHAARQPDPTT